MADQNDDRKFLFGPRKVVEVQLTPRVQVAATAITAILLAVCVVANATKAWSGEWDCVACFMIPLLLLAFVVLLTSTLRFFANRRLVRQMQAPQAETTEPDLVEATPDPIPVEQKPRAPDKEGPPPPPFAMQIYDMSTAPTLTPLASEREARASRHVGQVVRIWKWGFWFLVGGNVALALLNVLLHNDFAFLPMVVLWVLLVPTTAFFGLMTEGDYLTWSAGYSFWRTANVVWLGGTALFAWLSTCANTSEGLSAVATLAVSAGLQIAAVGLPLAYILWLRYMGSRLRRSVLTSQPIKLLYLWVFEPPAGKNLMASTLSPSWYVTGSVQFIRGSYLASEAKWMPSILLGHREEKYVTETPDELAAAIASFKTEPNWTGMYPRNSLLCSDSVWQLALETLLADTDVALMNLCGFTRERRGCAYEVDQLVDRLPTRHWLLVVDESTDLEYLEEVLRESWSVMVPDSPNRAADVAPVQVYRLAPAEKPEADAGTLLRAVTAIPTFFGAPSAEADRLFEILCEGALSSQ